jgi:hypothetical protein
MRQSLVVGLDLSKGRKGGERRKRTRDGQICLSIFDVVFGQYSGEFGTKIPVHFDAIRPGANQG